MTPNCEIVPRNFALDLNPRTAQLQRIQIGVVRLNQNHILVGCAPNALSPNYTSHAGQHFLKSKVDYGSLTDVVVWTYVFKTLGISLRCTPALGSS